MVIRDEKEYKDYEARMEKLIERGTELGDMELLSPEEKAEFTMLSEALDEYGRAYHPLPGRMSTLLTNPDTLKNEYYLNRMTKMKKVLFAFAAFIALTFGQAYGNKQTAAPETESGKVTNEVVTNDTISKEMKEANMQEVQAYLKECGAFFIATADGDQPHVRPFGVSEIIDGRLYIMTGKVKDVYKQIAANGKFEICALKKSGSEWMRLSGTLVNDETLAVKEEFLNRNQGLKSMYKADDDNMAVLYITNATARFCSFSAPERRVSF